MRSMAAVSAALNFNPNAQRNRQRHNRLKATGRGGNRKEAHQPEDRNLWQRHQSSYRLKGKNAFCTTGDAWVYYLPAISAKVATPVEGGGEFFLAFNSNKATVEAQTFFSSPQWAISRIKAAGSNGGWLS